MSTTLTLLATDSLIDLTVLVPGQTTSVDILTLILRYANRMLDQWRLDDLLAYAYPAALYNLQAALEQYRIGPGQVSPNFNAARPTGIADANIVINYTSTPTVRRQLTLWNKDEWAAISVRATPPGTTAPIAAIPIGMYFDGDFDATDGYATINLWPAPQFQPQQLELFTAQTMPFISFSSVTQSVNFPPGYELMVQTNLTVELISPLQRYIKGTPDLGLLREKAILAKAAVMSDNAPDALKIVQPAFRGQSARRSAFNYG